MITLLISIYCIGFIATPLIFSRTSFSDAFNVDAQEDLTALTLLVLGWPFLIVVLPIFGVTTAVKRLYLIGKRSRNNG